MADSLFNVFVGSETGVLKGVYFGQSAPVLKNFHSFKGGEQTSEITHIAWADDGEGHYQENLLIAYKNHVIKTYNREHHSFVAGVQLELNKLLDFENEKIVGIHSVDSNYLIGAESGKVSLWNFTTSENVLEIKVGDHLSKIRHCDAKKTTFATGGKESDLRIWDLKSESPSVPIFKARNLPHDFLDLRRPIWVQDLTFMPQTDDLVAICSRYGQVRLYDTKADTKGRPVINVQCQEHPLMAISTTKNDRQVLYGSSQGKLCLLDLRNPKDGQSARNYIGHSGGVRSISANPTRPHFVSCGLDRHLYLHHMEQNKPLKKMYLRSRLNCVLMADDFNLEDVNNEEIPIAWQNILMKPSPPSAPSTSLLSTPKRLKLGL